MNIFQHLFEIEKNILENDRCISFSSVLKECNVIKGTENKTVPWYENIPCDLNND